MIWTIETINFDFSDSQASSTTMFDPSRHRVVPGRSLEISSAFMDHRPYHYIITASKLGIDNIYVSTSRLVVMKRYLTIAGWFRFQ